MNQLIRCIHCNEIFFKTPFDQWPEYEFYSYPFPENFQSAEKDDFQDFLKNHRGHRFEELKILEDSFVSEKSYLEPVKISYFKATNGKENFVVKKFREKISEPLKYQLIAGDYFLKCSGIDIQSKEITKQLEREFMASPLSRSKINNFLKLYRQIADSMEIENLERVLEESSHPLEVYYKMDELSLAYLLRNCRRIFKGKEYLNIEEFIHRHKDDGVLLLKATFQVQIVEVAKSKKEAAAPIPFEARKVIEKK